MLRNMHFICNFCVVLLAFQLYSTAADTRIGRQSDRNDKVIFHDKPYKTGIAQKKCNSYISQACKGKLNREEDNFSIHTSVVGGREAHPKEFPHMALIGFGKLEEVKWACGGSLISENYVLSAAHCGISALGEAKWIRLGELDYASTTDDAKPVDFAIKQTIVHPGFKPPALYHDIALFKFEGIKEFSEYIRPICLNILNEINQGIASAVGWGATGYGEALSSMLMTVDLTIEKYSICDEVLAGEALPNKFNDTTMVCAGEIEGGKDTCQGDSGGPFQYKLAYSGCSQNFYSQVGIVSFGIGCGFSDTSAVYTKVAHYVPWIEEIVWGYSTFK